MGIKASIIVLGALFSQLALGQSDLAIEVSTSETPLRPAGSTGIVTVRLTNLGPEPTANPTPRVEVPNFGVLPVDFFTIPGENCNVGLGVLEPFNVDDPIVFVYSFSSPDLLAGASSECRASYAVNPSLEGDISLTWVIRSLATQPTDPNTSNNTATLTFGIPLPSQVPGLKTISVALMVFLFFMISMIDSFKRKHSDD